MATPTHTEKANPPRRTLAAGIATGAGIGALIGIIAAFILVSVLGAVQLTEELAFHAYLYLAFEAGFAGAVLGGAFAGLTRLRNTK
ncbi:MAG: hypothetical protein ACFE0P_07865 [Oceanicaulis sp.]